MSAPAAPGGGGKLTSIGACDIQPSCDMPRSLISYAVFCLKKKSTGNHRRSPLPPAPTFRLPAAPALTALRAAVTLWRGRRTHRLSTAPRPLCHVSRAHLSRGRLRGRGAVRQATPLFVSLC